MKDELHPRSNFPYFSKYLTTFMFEVVSFLGKPLSVEEIKEAVWDCGGERTSDPDGFSFKFLKNYWDILGNDVIAFVHNFFYKPIIPVGCNSSFLILIQKIDNPLPVKDFCPISLIEMQFKIIAKLLSNRLALVLLDVIMLLVWSSWLFGQILDGPLMVSESWFKNKKILILKLIFEKAYDSISWDYLDKTMVFMGFSDRWRMWISELFKNSRSSIPMNGSPTNEF